jgi:hypothetical protein
MLAPRRYVPGVGRDVMLQQWVQDWCRGATSVSTLADRTTTLDYLLRETARRFRKPTLLETGCVRSSENWGAAGNSTYLLGAFADGLGGQVISVDRDRVHCDFARTYCTDWPVKVVESDSVAFLKDYPGPIQVAYLDSMDVECPAHPEHGLAEFKAVEDKLTDNGLVLFDDTTWQPGTGWIGKGARAVPHALGRGFRIAACGYQVVLERG